MVPQSRTDEQYYLVLLGYLPSKKPEVVRGNVGRDPEIAGGERGGRCIHTLLYTYRKFSEINIFKINRCST